MINKRKKAEKQNFLKKQTQPKKSSTTNRLITKKNDYENSIEKIGNYVSNEMQKYNDDILGSNDILFLNSEQLIADKSEKDFGKVQIELKELKKIIREIVIEEIEKKNLK